MCLHIHICTHIRTHTYTKHAYLNKKKHWPLYERTDTASMRKSA